LILPRSFAPEVSERLIAITKISVLNWTIRLNLALPEIIPSQSPSPAINLREDFAAAIADISAGPNRIDISGVSKSERCARKWSDLVGDSKQFDEKGLDARITTMENADFYLKDARSWPVSRTSISRSKFQGHSIPLVRPSSMEHAGLTVWLGQFGLSLGAKGQIS
jgi:hypothetical protein